jgi:RNA polymerase sigma-70 factor (ECF subfamily)
LVDRPSDKDIAGACSNGPPHALVLVYRHIGPLGCISGLRSLGVRTDAEDVTQQVFVSAWCSRASFDRDRGTLPAPRAAP